MSQYDTFACHPLYDEAFKLTTVLTRAITCEAHRKTKYLLEKGCDPNSAAGKNRVRPLMVAGYVSNDRKRMTIFRCLVKHGADPTLRDVYGRNSVMYACALGLRGETELLVKDCDYDLNATDMYGDTALHMCAKAGGAQVLGVVLRQMLKHRMDISVQNHACHTPLSLAVLNGNHKCAKILYQAGGSPRYLSSPFEESSKLQDLRSDPDVRIAWDDITRGVYPGGMQAAACCGQKRDAVKSELKPATSLRKQENVPKLFTRVRVESASEICKAHSGSRTSQHECLSLRAEVPSKEVSTGNVKSSGLQMIGHQKECAQNEESATLGQPNSDRRGHAAEPNQDECNSTVSTRPATSMDCINAILNSPAYKTRLASSFSQPSKTIVRVDSQWLTTINTYKVAAIEESVYLPKVQISTGGRQRTSATSISSSSASSSHSQLFRSKVLKHMMTSPRLFKVPQANSPLPRGEECHV